MQGGGRPGPRLRCNELARVPLKGQPGRFWAGPTMLDAERPVVSKYPGLIFLGYKRPKHPRTPTKMEYQQHMNANDINHGFFSRF